jgi:endonuclease I
VPPGYYDAANGLTGAQLKTALYNIIKNHTVRTYANLWTDFQTTDKKTDGKVWDMYSNCVFTFVSNQCGNYNSECDCYNREHSVPNSWFNGEVYPMYSDLFQLYPTDGYVNNRRGNYPFGEVSAPTYTSGNGSKLGPCSYAGYTSTVFEPVNEYKGDFARTYFYMATRYENIIETWTVNLLLKWNAQDPVSQKEIDRNNVVYGIQHNRNPFIDHPEWGPTVWGGNDIFEYNSIIFNNIMIYPNPASEKVTLSDISNVDLLQITDITGKILYSYNNSAESVDIKIDDYEPGFYFIRVFGESNQSKSFKLIIN